MGETQPSTSHFDGHSRATATAKEAFSNGWISLDELDKLLANINQAPTPERAFNIVAPLNTIERRVHHTAGTTTNSGNALRVAATILFYLCLLAFLINVLIWVIIAITNEALYFWPIWLSIPLFITGFLTILAEKMTRK
ncbi:MAG: hypothetical protein Q4A31_10170 [Corynebacterium sp.]|uniref:hypothetical protein n=1 Tax=Corynebacterium sp. TaxID=1720 RepID=UPI0026DD4D7D|nr:hypothetical protein [Corynebacterium sp.]MDO4762273.1 hypothetical protein [Corynebacterium sp.]